MNLFSKPRKPLGPVALAYKNLAANRAVSHIGLGVTALNALKVLRREGIGAQLWPVTSVADLRRNMEEDMMASHVIISAPWISTSDLANLCNDFPDQQIVVNCHSNLGFLQADPGAVRLLREGMELHMTCPNFHIAANSHRLAEWVQATYGAPCVHLPNFYCLDQERPTAKVYRGGVLRIGAFGATRALKNLTTAAGAALQIARIMQADLEFWISAGRSEGAGPVLDSVRQMMAGLPHVRLVESGWQPWPQFRKTAAHMHLMLQPSYTESFNVVTADGVAEGVPSVVSDAIDWAPENWKAPVDDVNAIALTGVRLLQSRNAAKQGWNALVRHNDEAVRIWQSFLQQR